MARPKGLPWFIGGKDIWGREQLFSLSLFLIHSIDIWAKSILWDLFLEVSIVRKVGLGMEGIVVMVLAFFGQLTPSPVLRYAHSDSLLLELDKSPTQWEVLQNVLK